MKSKASRLSRAAFNVAVCPRRPPASVALRIRLTSEYTPDAPSDRPRTIQTSARRCLRSDTTQRSFVANVSQLLTLPLS